ELRGVRSQELNEPFLASRVPFSCCSLLFSSTDRAGLKSCGRSFERSGISALPFNFFLCVFGAAIERSTYSSTMLYCLVS
ncbi:hypothetical protein SDJN02_24587, partial [Cucurbita argyrosperma subsp. argyrosperma]